jgi:hypothetical protein
MFKKRLEWEVKKGRITREEADAWIFAPNSKVSCFPKSRLTAQEMREALGWIKQTDGVSCGPLALAACLSLDPSRFQADSRSFRMESKETGEECTKPASLVAPPNAGNRG